MKFILPLAFKVRKGDRIVFYNCALQEGDKGCLFINNRCYSSLEIYRKGARKPEFELDGKEAYRRERHAYRDMMAARKNILAARRCGK
ncbi:hypothetical protein A3K73_08470 [Candidatus Pacearchaeota archaeon RBG_13_36_9]|nr:MAG: hypothetical protein A3K73_08470 [Candidatus Pacearchaeota archaeon RBG_13_36_9]